MLEWENHRYIEKLSTENNDVRDVDRADFPTRKNCITEIPMETNVRESGSQLPHTGHRLRRDVSLLGLTFAVVGSIIGSGWLLGALSAAQVAGPASIISWVLAAIIVAILALVHAELSAAYPVAGGSARFPYYAFGGLAAFTAGWMGWIFSVTLAPIEVEAALQYATNYLPGLTQHSGTVAVLTPMGYLVAAILMLIFTAINAWGVGRMSETNTVVVWWKIAIPVLTIIVLGIAAFHPGNFTAGGGFAPFGVKGVLEALPAGVVFALIGFEQAVELAGEARNPGRTIPRAIIGAQIIGTIVYLLLQVVFIAAVSPQNLAHGWANPIGKGSFGPYAGLATGLGLTWMAVLLYIDAFLSPAGTALLYVGCSARLSYALAREGYIPTPFARLSVRGVPIISLIFSFIIGMLLFLPFPGWQEFVGFVTSAAVLMYVFTPLAYSALHRGDPDYRRPFVLKGGRVLAPISFIAANLLVYWSGWGTVWRLLAVLVLGYILMAISLVTSPANRRPALHWRTTAWMWPYLIGMAVISYLGQYGGGISLIPLWLDIVVVIVFSLIIFYWAVASVRPVAEVREAVDQDRNMEVLEVPATTAEA
jgi:amino acid transporter